MELVERNMNRLASTVAAGFGPRDGVVSHHRHAGDQRREEAIAYGDAAVAVAGEANVNRDAPPVMGSEDSPT